MRGVKKRQGKVTTSMTPSPALLNLALPSSDVASERSLGLLGGQPRRLSIRRSGTSHKQGHWLNELQRRLHVHRHTSPPPTFTWLTSGWGPVTCALLRARTPRGLGYTLRREGRGPIPQALPPDELYVLAVTLPRGHRLETSLACTASASTTHTHSFLGAVGVRLEMVHGAQHYRSDLGGIRGGRALGSERAWQPGLGHRTQPVTRTTHHNM